mmetsp:Transcript_24868/g.42311  ORF Transcript_24868/g.42311 Transcript_24868/m.42311 type:complete len:107 (-) Transcript_24868:1086-1406(-)
MHFPVAGAKDKAQSKRRRKEDPNMAEKGIPSPWQTTTMQIPQVGKHHLLRNVFPINKLDTKLSLVKPASCKTGCTVLSLRDAFESCVYLTTRLFRHDFDEPEFPIL